MTAHHGSSENDIEEAYLKAEPKILSPASPKPIHFPQPSNIPVLDNMMDVGFNQTEAHMDANSRDTELRPGAWRDPNESESADQPSPFSTGGEATESAVEDLPTEIAEESTAAEAHSTQALPNGHDTDSLQISNGLSFATNSFTHTHTDVAPTVHTTASEAPLASSDPSVPTNATQAQSVEISADQQSTPFPSAVNVQALLDTLQTSITPAQSDAQPSADTNASSPVAASGLPPRPPPQEQPMINPNYVQAQNIRDYHPHAASQQQSPTSAGFAAHSASQGQAQQFQKQYATSSTPIESRREFKIAAGETPTMDDQPWTADIQRKYDHFMEEERRYVNEARWDQFPNGSRLFVGNLSSEKVTKRDIFHVFHTYGELAQISIKQAYGFVQFLRTEDCMRALDAEQGRQIRDKRIHLEISKPQKPSRNQQPNQGRRSRSPDNRRGQGNNRYNDNRGRRDGRDSREYRPTYRSPSPRDRYDGRYRTRSRSPGYRSDRYRGGSPRREAEDDLPLPRRQPRDVPDVQVIVLDTLERDFVSWVEKAFSSRQVRVDVLTISPRLAEEAVVRRQIVEGVIAVCKLRRVNQDTSKIGLTIFKRRGGTRDVQFEEYDNLDPGICTELVLREKQSLGLPTAAPSYGGPQYTAPAPPAQYGYQQPLAPYQGPPTGYPPGYGQPPPAASYGAQHPAAMSPHGYPPQPQPPRVDSNNLQNLLSTLNTASPAAPSQSYGIPHRPGYPPAQQYTTPQQYPSQPGYPGSAQPQQSPQQSPSGQAPPNMQDILARLGTYRQ